MLPLQLKIKGLYSYQEEQIIDFDELTQAGLFGIFGNVGSGKSSILEAIGYVLYSETERLNSRDGRAYNMLNLKSDEALIDFEFLNFEERKFKFTARWTRNKKNFEDVGTIKRLAYEWITASWLPLESADAEAVIGLSYENFRRTIIIPQGQFKEFLELRGKDRSEMMKAIFNLQQFDLGWKVNHLQAETRNKQNELEGKLSVYETVSKEIVDTNAIELLSIKTKLTASQKELELIEAEVVMLNALKDKFLQVAHFTKVFSSLWQDKPEMDALAVKVTLFEKTEKCFKSNLENAKKLNGTLHSLKSELENLEQKKAALASEVVILKDEIEILKPKYSQLEESKKYADELDSILKIKVLKNTIAGFVSSTEKDNKNLVWLEEQMEIFDKDLQIKTAKTQTLKSQKLDTELLISIENWYNTAKAQEDFIKNLKAEVESITDNLAKEKQLFSNYKYDAENWKTEIAANKLKLETDVDLALKQQQSLLLSNELASYTANLHDGSPCPLCGSESHPNVMHIDDVTEKLNSCNALIFEFKKQLNAISLQEKELSTIEAKIEFINAEKVVKETALNQKVLENIEHRKLFVWNDFHANDSATFTAKKQTNQKIEAELKVLDAEIVKIQSQIDVKKKQKEQLNAKLSVVQSSISENTGALKNEIGKLTILKADDFANRDNESISTQRDALIEENRITKISYEAKAATMIEKSQLIATNEALIATKNIDYKSVKTQCEEVQQSIDKQLLENNFNHIDEVQLILNQQIDVEKERKSIEEFSIHFQTTENQLQLLNTELQGKQFDADECTEKSKLFEEKKQVVNQLIGESKSKSDQLEALKMQLKEKEELRISHEFVKKRSQNLSILNALFQANGFVNYVSTIYLQNLCDVANVRFHRMTKNHLSLMINDKNEFDVIDYLNNGNKRSVKTLSGGQLFQASLCLALALAESVQTNAKGDKNFFFIDEGFGTQDQESIAIVFETLQTLYKENRIVGIISHVAEMKESIPRSITVEKDPERGSLIKTSWN